MENAMDLDLDIEFLAPEGKHGPAKATVHKSGKLGFSLGAHMMVDFEKNKLFKIGRKKTESDATNNDVLIMLPVDSEDDLTFKVQSAGGYYYLKTKRLLNQLNIDYRNESETVSFDIDEIVEKGKKYFKLVRRKKK
jgi:hypothetical protein